MKFKDKIEAMRRYVALKKCVKHALLTYRYGSAFVASSGGLGKLISLAPSLLNVAKKSAKPVQEKQMNNDQ